MKKLLTVLAVLIVTAGLASAQTPVNLYGRAAQGTEGVVAAAKPEASQVGVDILKRGGNAVDAAVATGFALGVLEANASGIGGGGFMIIKMANMRDAVVIDFRETAPAAATADMYKYGADGKIINSMNTVGGLASGVPGEVAGLLYAFDNYGSKRISRAALLEPAIQFAERGYTVTANLSPIIADNLAKINKYPATAAIYTDGGLPPEIGDTIRNPDLARTLRLVAKDGVDAIYKGAMAERIAKAVRDAGGIMTAQDLANYKVKVRKPVTGTYRGYSIISTPPASSGGTHVIQILNILENMDIAKLGVGTPQTAHAWVEALRLAFADRGKYMADADFVKVPLAGLTNKTYAKELYGKINMNKAMGSAAASDPTKYESGSTTSFSVMDKAGNMVTVTKSINYFFGSGVTVPGAGFIMNNHMDDFALKPGSVQSIEPGKRPLSSMTPTLVLDPNGQPFMTLGSPGATRIIAAVAQIISNVIDHGMPIQQAIFAPRLFAMASGQVQVEGRTSINTLNGLKALGHDVNVRGDWDAYFGGVHAVLFDRQARILYGGADPRRDGQAAGF
ncbi:MAG: gamma-glutamyltransferase [Clostridia bacterium]